MKKFWIILLLIGMVGCKGYYVEQEVDYGPYSSDYKITTIIRNDVPFGYDYIIFTTIANSDKLNLIETMKQEYCYADSIGKMLVSMEVDCTPKEILTFIASDPEYQGGEIDTDGYIIWEDIPTQNINEPVSLVICSEIEGSVYFILERDSLIVELENIELNEAAKIFVDYLKKYVPHRIDSLETKIKEYKEMEKIWMSLITEGHITPRK